MFQNFPNVPKLSKFSNFQISKSILKSAVLPASLMPLLALQSGALRISAYREISFVYGSHLKIKALEMLVAPQISKCFGVPWSAIIVCLGLL